MSRGADGYVEMIRTADGLAYEWHGGDTIWISRELLKHAYDGVFSNRAPSSDEVFMFGPFTLRCTAHLLREQVIEAVRIHDER